MKSLVSLVLLLSLIVIGVAQIPQKMETYEAKWQTVEELEKDQKPQSAIKLIDDVLAQAKKEGDTGQRLKALLKRSALRNTINSENKYLLIRELNELLKETKSADDKAIVNSLLAVTYENYYLEDAWQIRQRTKLENYVPDDMAEWSSNIYENKIREHVSKSIENKEALLKVSPDKYAGIIEKGEDSKGYYPTLYDFLMKKGFSLLERTDANPKIKDQQIGDVDKFLSSYADTTNLVLNYYKEYLNDLSVRNMENTFVLTELNRLHYLMGYENQYSIKEYLIKLEAKYADKEISIDIISSIVEYLTTWANKEYEEQANIDKLKVRYDWLKKGVDRFPNSKKIANLKNQLAELEKPTVSINAQSTYYPTKEKKVNIRYKNKETVSLKVKDAEDNIVFETKLALKPKATYLQQDTTINLPINKIGTYSLLIDNDDTDGENTFRISQLLGLSRSFKENSYEVIALDRVTGKPLENVSVEISKTDSWNDEKAVIKTIQTDKQGFAHYAVEQTEKRQYLFYRLIDKKSGDTSDYSSLYRGYYPSNSHDDYQEGVEIFTDRSIYRPGQTVYFKTIAFSKKDQSANLLTNKSIKVSLYDTNGQIVAEKNLKTSEFGSVSGEFVLPKSTLNGYFSIQTDLGGYNSLRVEEYKRPTFEVKFDKNEETYSFGDKITLKGQAETYSGVKLQGATVNYRINKAPLFFRMSGGHDFIGSGKVKTSYDGSFDISFQIPEKTTKTYSKLWFPETYMFTVAVDVKDENGEIQSTTTYVSVGEVSMKLNLTLPDKFNKERGGSIVINAENLSGSPIEAKGNIDISKINKKDTTSIAQMSFNSGKQEQLEKKLKSLASGEYLITLSSKDDKNRKIETKQNIIIYSIKDKRPPVETNDWMIVNDSILGDNSNAVFSLNKPAKIALGASAKDVTVIYEIMSAENKVLNREFIKLNNSIKDILIPYKQEYKNSITVLLTYVIDEEVYSKQVRLDKEEEKKEFKLKFDVFRDNLRPGQQEEWRISILDQKNQPSSSEVLASMYDRSLDQIQQTGNWDFNPIPYNYYSVSTLSETLTRNRFFYYNKRGDIQTVDEFNYKFDDFKLISDFEEMISGVMATDVPEMDASMEKHDEVLYKEDRNLVKEESNAMGYSSGVMSRSKQVAAPEVAGGSAKESPQIRQNFNETAFFYPQLRTNERGEISINFLVPESNTSWKFRALAYDKNLNVGNLEAIAVSKKELMVTPNAPRFLREGDKTSISTKVSNLSDNPINGEVKIEFFDPLTDKIIDLKVDAKTQQFSIAKGTSSSVQWTFDVPQGIDLIGYRIVAKNEMFSDGEQHALSVLPNRMLVTESMSIDMLKAGNKEFVFDRFLNSKSPTADNYKLTFEYASNPAWYAIQALPALSNPTNDNSINWFASYYANTLASHMLKKYPKVSSMIKAWQASGENAETLVSKLEKNDELKLVLLEETPWVLDAKNETEQMQRLALLFDLNRTVSVQNSAIEKLKELQTSEGGWSWYKGSYPSRSITQYVLYGFSSLIELNAVEYPQAVKEMQISALKYIDKAILDDFTSLKKNDKKWKDVKTLSTNQLEYLYVRSAYRDIPINQETREAERFYTSVAEKNWTKLSLYERSILLVLANRNGNKVLAQKIFSSLKEFATVKENLGMYWEDKASRNRCFISSSSVPVHTFLMEAFREMKASDEDMNLMKQWLLSQKRTQLWESTHATIDAISILLSTGDDWFGIENSDKIKVGKLALDMNGSEKGTGYIKQSWGKSEINNDLARVSIDKSGATPSFGAMYWQYYEDLDKISQQKTGLAVDKKLFKENVSDKGISLSELTSTEKLKVGDKVVVRLIVRADRDFDFVQLKDMRAACFEPTQMTSGRNWRGELSYYQETKDASTNFFIDYLSKGTYVLEYSVYVNRSGNYSNGISTIQCLYAPEFTSHTGGIRVEVAK